MIITCSFFKSHRNSVHDFQRLFHSFTFCEGYAKKNLIYTRNLDTLSVNKSVEIIVKSQVKFSFKILSWLPPGHDFIQTGSGGKDTLSMYICSGCPPNGNSFEKILGKIFVSFCRLFNRKGIGVAFLTLGLS